LFDPKSDADLAEAILALAQDKGLRSQMGASGRECAVENFDLVRNVKRWANVLLH
jgi:glycosyltransferase involved in cell wall biosynthesis